MHELDGRKNGGLMLLPVLAVLAAASAVAFFVWHRHGTARAMIEGELAGRATEVDISPDWFDFDRDTLTYDVAYTDANGRRINNRAKVAITPLADASVFWQQPLS